VQSLDGAAARLLARTHATLAGLGRTLLFTEASSWWDTLTRWASRATRSSATTISRSSTASTRCSPGAFPRNTGTRPSSSRSARCSRASTSAALATLDGVLARRSWSAGQTIIVAGQRSDELFVIVRGSAMVSIPTQEGVARLAVFTPGMSFGEVAFMDHAARTANVTAIDSVECRVLTQEAFARLEHDAPCDQDQAPRESRARADGFPAAGRTSNWPRCAEGASPARSGHADASRRSTSTSSICSGRRWRSGVAPVNAGRQEQLEQLGST
jgi:hypothetical protein